MRELWQAAAGAFGRVDAWVNNAGASAARKPLWEQSDEDLRRVVESNLTGTLFGLKVPVAAMIEQGGGQVWMTEGFGSDGATQPGMAAYAPPSEPSATCAKPCWPTPPTHQCRWARCHRASW